MSELTALTEQMIQTSRSGADKEEAQAVVKPLTEVLADADAAGFEGL